MDRTSFTVGVVLSPRPWSVRLHAFVADHVTNVDVVVVRDRRAAIDAHPHVLVIDDSTPWLTPSFTSDAGRDDIRLVGVYNRTDPGGRDRLVELGLTHLLEESMPPEEVVFLLERLRPLHGTHPVDVRSLDEHTTSTELGNVIAVGGPSGSGARELAVGLATAWGTRSRPTILVDCNETTPGVARRLGLGLYPHVLAAIDRCRADGLSGVEAALADQVPRLPFDVIVGLATPRDWDRLVAHDVLELLDACRDGWERVVVTTSPLIEDLQRWGDRFGVSRSVLSTADMVVGAVEPSPRGALRYLDWFADVAQLRTETITVVNKVPRTQRAAAEVVRQLDDVVGNTLGDVYRVPFDRRVIAAEWDGTIVQAGPFAKAVASLAHEIDTRLATTRRVEVSAP